MNDDSAESPKASERMRMHRLDLSLSASGKPQKPRAVPRLLQSPLAVQVAYLPLQAARDTLWSKSLLEGSGASTSPGFVLGRAAEEPDQRWRFQKSESSLL